MLRAIALALLLSLCGCAAFTSRVTGPPEGLRTDCVNGAVIGLSWNAPPAAGHHSAYHIIRNGMEIAVTRAHVFADTSVSPGTEYSYVVALENSASPALNISTPAQAPNGNAPYCRSPVIGSIDWNWHGYTQPNGSDLWPVTWGSDGKVYTFFGDGGGFGGDNYRGRASFGIATLPPDPPESPALPNGARNVFGGLDAPYVSTLAGKAGSIIAVGRDFYTLGGIYSTAELGASVQKSGSPARVQLAYSHGDAHSWQAADWSFCGVTEAYGVFCPIGFVNFGRGNSGAPQGRIYMVGFANRAEYWTGASRSAAADTYLARVRPGRILDRSAYEYFAGTDLAGAPLWSTDSTRMKPVFTDRNSLRPGCGGQCDMASPMESVVYNAALKRYLAVAQGEFVGQTSFYDAPAPWGPWTVVSYNNIDAATGTGGWANLGTAGGSSLGVNIINAWTSADGLRLWMIYSSDGKAPPGALFPPPGTALDSFNLIRASLQLRAAQQER